MSAEIREVADAEIKLVAGSGGVFDVRCNGSLVFSKFREGRFPDVGELAMRIGDLG